MSFNIIGVLKICSFIKRINLKHSDLLLRSWQVPVIYIPCEQNMVLDVLAKQTTRENCSWINSSPPTSICASSTRSYVPSPDSTRSAILSPPPLVRPPSTGATPTICHPSVAISVASASTATITFSATSTNPPDSILTLCPPHAPALSPH